MVYLYLALVLLVLLLLLFLTGVLRLGKRPGPSGERFGVGIQEDIDCISQPLDGGKGACSWRWQDFQDYRQLPAGYGN